MAAVCDEDRYSHDHNDQFTQKYSGIALSQAKLHKTPLLCVVPGCSSATRKRIFASYIDLVQHIQAEHSPKCVYCPGSWCLHATENGFTGAKERDEHIFSVHGRYALEGNVDIQNPARPGGPRAGKRGGLETPWFTPEDFEQMLQMEKDASVRPTTALSRTQASKDGHRRRRNRGYGTDPGALDSKSVQRPVGIVAVNNGRETSVELDDKAWDRNIDLGVQLGVDTEAGVAIKESFGSINRHRAESSHGTGQWVGLNEAKLTGSTVSDLGLSAFRLANDLQTPAHREESCSKNKDITIFDLQISRDGLTEMRTTSDINFNPAVESEDMLQGLDHGKLPENTKENAGQSQIQRLIVWLMLRSTAEAIRKVSASLLVFRAPLLPAGKRRAAWSCHCGHQSFDDFIELSEGAVAEYESSLRKRYTEPEVSEVGTSHGILGLTPALFRFIQFMKLPGIVQQQASSVTFQSTPLQLAAPIAPRPDCLFLLLCLPYHNRGTRLLQLDLRDVQDDKCFFYLVRNNYRQTRGKFKRMFSLRTVKSIKFVQFELRRSQLVNIRKEDDLPPETLKEEYMYNPMPAEMIPPLGENYMMHLFSHPNHADPKAKEDLNRIPKKLKDRLAICPTRGRGIGWGVHFVEGWHLSALSLVAYVVFLIASLVFLVCWTVLKQDIQGASGVAAYILAFATLSVGSLQAAFELELL